MLMVVALRVVAVAAHDGSRDLIDLESAGTKISAKRSKYRSGFATKKMPMSSNVLMSSRLVR